MEKLYWSEDYDTFPRMTFIEIDFVKKTVSREKGTKKIVEGDLSEIKHAITQVIKELELKNKEIDSKLTQTKKVVNIPIENGYKIRKKPTLVYREKLNIQKKGNILRIKELKSFDTASLLK